MLTLGTNISTPTPGTESFVASTKSLALDGAGDYATFTQTAFKISGVGNDLSIAFWAKRTDNNDAAWVLGISDSASIKRLNFGADGTTLEIEGDTNGQQASGDVTADTNWHHYVITIEGKDGGNPATITMYEDGSDISATNTNLGASSAKLTISRIGAAVDPAGNTHEFKGLLYDLAIFNKILSPGHVIALAADPTIALENNQGNYTASTALVHLWRFENTDDSIGNLDLTYAGNTAASSTIPS